MPVTPLPQVNDDGVSLPLSGTIAAAMQHVPEALAGPTARRALGEIARHLPAALTRRAYLECRLTRTASRVDLVLCVDTSTRALVMDPRRDWIPTRLRVHRPWAGIERLCSRWSASRSRIGRRIYDVWLEFDAAEGMTTPDALVPSIFLGLARSGRSTAPELWRGAIRPIEIVAGRRLDAAVAAAAHKAVVTLPPRAKVQYVGMMYPRDRRAIRLCLSPMAGAELLEYLKAVGWPGPVDGLEHLLRAIRVGHDRTALEAATLLHLDVLDDVQPRIGLEIPLAQHCQVVEGIVERTLLDDLCARDLCAPEKRDALLQWPGHAVERLPHQCWPSLVLRRVSHVKIVYEQGHPAEAKAYLSFFHHFSKRSRQGVHSTAQRGCVHQETL